MTNLITITFVCPLGLGKASNTKVQNRFLPCCLLWLAVDTYWAGRILQSGPLPDIWCPALWGFWDPSTTAWKVTSFNGNYLIQFKCRDTFWHTSVCEESTMMPGLSVVVSTFKDRGGDSEPVWRQTGWAADKRPLGRWMGPHREPNNHKLTMDSSFPHTRAHSHPCH